MNTILYMKIIEIYERKIFSRYSTVHLVIVIVHTNLTLCVYVLHMFISHTLTCFCLG